MSFPVSEYESKQNGKKQRLFKRRWIKKRWVKHSARIALSAIVACTCSWVASSAVAQDDSAKFDLSLTGDSFESWRDHILPSTSDLGWQQIPWLTTFKDGILAANDADKPLLLWTMNGHPLGCT